MTLADRGPMGLKGPKPIKDRKHLEAVKMLPCVICGAPPPSDAHHVIHDRWGQLRACDRATIPLCKGHHQDGPESIHQNKRAWREKHGPDYGFLNRVKRQIAEIEDDILGKYF